MTIIERPFAGERIRFAQFRGPISLCGLAVSEHGIAALVLGREHEIDDLISQSLPGAVLQEDAAGLADLTRVVANLLASPEVASSVTLDLRGSPIEMAVWEALREIAPGHLVTYGEVARTLRVQATAFEVGAACAANRIAVLVPCHRVVKADGGLSGYRWGPWRKRQLISLEQSKWAA